MSSRKSPTQVLEHELTLVNAAGKPTGLHGPDCPHATSAQDAGKPGYPAKPTRYRKATAEEFKKLPGCKSCVSRMAKAAAPKVKRQPMPTHKLPASIAPEKVEAARKELAA